MNNEHNSYKPTIDVEMREDDVLTNGAKNFSQVEGEAGPSKEVMLKQINVPRRGPKGNGGMVWARHQFVIGLACAGYNVQEISDLSGYGIGTIYQILNSEEAKSQLKQLMSVYDDQFKRLYPKVVKSINEGLDYPDMDIKHKNAALWLKYNKGLEKQPSSIHVTAEDVVMNILNNPGE